MGALIIFPIAAVLAVLGKRKFEETVFPAVGIVTITLMLTGMLGSLKLGVFIIPIYLIISIVFLFIRKSEIKKYVITSGFTALIVFIIFFLIFSHNRFFISDSALSEYGLAARNMFDTGFLKDASPYYGFNWPVPFVSVWAYYCCFTGGGFSEWVCIFAYDVFIISAVLPLFSRINSLKDEPWQWLLAWLFCILLPILKNPGAYSMYDMAIPQAMSMVYAYLMFSQLISFKLREGSKWWYAGYAGYGIFLSCILTRYGVYAAIPLVMVMCSVAVSDVEKRKFILSSLYGGCLLASVFSMYGILSAGIGADRIPDVPVCFVTGMVLSMVLTLLLELYVNGYRKTSLVMGILIMVGIGILAVFILQNSANSEHLMDWLTEYTDKIFVGRKEEADYIIGKRVIPIFDAPFLFLMMVVFALASSMVEKKSLHKTAEIYAYNLSFVVGMVMYMVILCILYVNAIRRPHTALKPSIAVYIAPVAILSVLAALTQCLRAWKKDIVLAFGTAALAACVFSDPVSAIFNKPEYEDSYPIITECRNNGQLELARADRIFYIDKNLTEELPAPFSWAVFPAGADFINGLYFNPEPYKWDDNIREPLTAEELVETLEEGSYTYVYIKNVDDFFVDTYYPLFANLDEDIRNDALYSVDYDEEGRLQIEYIAGLEQEEPLEGAE